MKRIPFTFEGGFDSPLKVPLRMKKASDNLYRLIQAMAPAEKAYFKRFAGLYTKGDRNNYVILFDLMNQQSEYDEQKIVSDLKKFEVNTALKRLKHDLEGLVFKALRLFGSDNPFHAKLTQSFSEIEVCINKGLFDLATKKYHRIFEYCSKNEVYAGLFWASGYAQILLQAEFIYDIGKAEHYFGELRRFAREFVNQQDYEELSYAVGHILYATDDRHQVHFNGRREKLERLLSNDLLADDQLPLSEAARVKRYQILGRIYEGMEDYRSAHVYSQLIVGETEKLLADDPRSLRIRMSHFIAIHNHMKVCLKLYDFSGLDHYACMADNLMASYSELQKYQFTIQTIRVAAYSLQGRFHESVELGQKSLDDSTLDPTDSSVTYFVVEITLRLAVASFAIHDFRKTGSYLLEFDRLIGNDKKKYFYQMFEARLLRSALALEKDDLELFISQVRSLNRWVVQFAPISDRIATVVEQLNTLELLPELEMRRQYEQMLIVFQKMKNGRSKKLFEWFPFDQWILSKINGVSFADQVRLSLDEAKPIDSTNSKSDADLGEV